MDKEQVAINSRREDFLRVPGTGHLAEPGFRIGSQIKEVSSCTGPTMRPTPRLSRLLKLVDIPDPDVGCAIIRTNSAAACSSA